VIPLNAPAPKAVARMIERADALGFNQPEHFLWHACKHCKFDPTKPLARWNTAWHSLRNAASLPGLRFHDLRHTVITELAERGVPDSVIMSIAGHLSKRMLDHYSHIRLAAKRQALDDLDDTRTTELRPPDAGKDVSH
jgi:integrase